MCDYIFCIYTYTYTYIIICWYNCTLVNVDKAIAPSSTNTYVRKGLPYIHTGIETYEKLNRWHEHKGLQHTAPLQRTAPHCNTLHRTATRCNTTATHSRGMSTWVCNTPHHCNHCFTLHRTALHCSILQHAAPHCNAQHHTATHCNALQHTATPCNTLEHTGTHWNTLKQTVNTLQHTRTGGLSTRLQRGVVGATQSALLADGWHGMPVNTSAEGWHPSAGYDTVCVCVCVCLCVCVCGWVCCSVFCSMCCRVREAVCVAAHYGTLQHTLLPQ